MDGGPTRTTVPRRRGRPPRADALRNEVARAVVVAPLLAPSPGWTSHTIARAAGTSQSMVARIWRQTFVPIPEPLGGLLPATGLRLVAASTSAENSLLVLASPGAPEAPLDTGPFMRSPRRAPLQTVLAADLLASTRPPITAGPDLPIEPLDDVLVEAVRRRLGASTTLYVLTRHSVRDRESGGDAGGGFGGFGGFGVVQVVIEGALAWQGLLEPLVRRCTTTPMSSLLGAQHRAMEWARAGAARYEWIDPELTEPVGAQPRSAGPTAPPPRAAAQALADEAFAVLLDRITVGRLRGGDRITETSLARSLRTSRSHVRDALRVLATSGLVQLEPHRGALVPLPQVADVVEIYAARRALGAVLLRRATRWAPGDLDPVERALDDLLEAGRTGDARATGEADLRFQDALARATGMRRIPPMFAALTAQLRLYIAVMGLTYAYSIADMCRDDAAVLRHLRARDEAAALAAWHRKIDDALDYMTTQLGQPGHLVHLVHPGQRSPGHRRPAADRR